MWPGVCVCEWRHTPEACAEDFGGFEKSHELSISVRRRRLTFGARRDQTSSLRRGAARVGGGGRWKSQHRKIVYHSPYVEKPFNSKVIKSFVPELRSCKCFWVSGFLCYLYMSYEHSMYISHIRIMGMLKNDDRNALFSHWLDRKHTFNFSQTTLIKPIHCETLVDC